MLPRITGLVLLAVAWTSAAQAKTEGPNTPCSYVGVDVRDLATRHYYNPFDGLMFDRNPYPDGLVDDAHTLVSFLSETSRPELGRGSLLSVRALEWSPGRLRFVAIAKDRGRPIFTVGTFSPLTFSLTDLNPVKLKEAAVFISLRDLTLSVGGNDGAIRLVDPIGAGGYVKDGSNLLMTPVMRPEVTRTPGRDYLDRKRYRHEYMIESRSKPSYYEGLPFIRLRRFDQPVDEFGIHGPISQGGTFPIKVGLRGEAIQELRFMAHQQTVNPEKLVRHLADDGLIDEESRLVRGRISNGCIRLRARDIRELFVVLADLPLGAPVTVSYSADPTGAFHPFPWESRRFAIATDEKDEDGLTVMYTGAIRNPAGRGEAKLPFPDSVERTQEETRADRAVDATLRSKRRPADLRRLLAKESASDRARRKSAFVGIGPFPLTSPAIRATRRDTMLIDHGPDEIPDDSPVPGVPPDRSIFGGLPRVDDAGGHDSGGNLYHR